MQTHPLAKYFWQNWLDFGSNVARAPFALWQETCLRPRSEANDAISTVFSKKYAYLSLLWFKFLLKTRF